MKQKLFKLTAWALVLAVILGAVTLLYDRLVDRERLAQAAATPDHTPPSKQTEVATPSETQDPERKMAPEFTIYDRNGKIVTLADFRGKPVVICFWASWRDDCIQQMPILQAAYDDYKDSVHFLMINMPDGNRETREKADAFIQERGYTFPVYYDTDSVAAINYNVQSVPSIYFIDDEGKAMAYAGAKIGRAVFEKGLARCYHDD